MPTQAEDSEGFELAKTGRGYSIPLKGVLQKMKLDFLMLKYIFTIKPFDFGAGMSGFELLSDTAMLRTGLPDDSEE